MATTGNCVSIEFARAAYTLVQYNNLASLELLANYDHLVR